MRVEPTLRPYRHCAPHRIPPPEPHLALGTARDPVASARDSASATPEPTSPRSRRALSPPRVAPAPARPRRLAPRLPVTPDRDVSVPTPGLEEPTCLAPDLDPELL